MEAPFGAPGFPFAKWEQLCHAKLEACELSAEHLADASSRNVNDWIGITLSGELLVNLLDTVVHLLTFFTPGRCHTAAMRKGGPGKHEKGLHKSKEQCFLSES